MKKITVFMITLLMSVTVMMAQEQVHQERKRMEPKERAEKMTERMAKEYSLNDAQKQQLLELNLTVTEKIGGRQALPRNKEGKGTMKADKKNKKVRKSCEAKSCECKKGREKGELKRQNHRLDYDARIKEIMTEDQYKAYSTKRAERPGRPAGNHRGHGHQRSGN